MDGCYEVTENGQTVGSVALKQEGLYVSVSCRCELLDHGIHRLYADGEKLGVLIPENGELKLKTRVPAKRLKQGCRFTIGDNNGVWIPICPGEAFAHLEKLRTGRLGFREGEPGLILK